MRTGIRTGMVGVVVVGLVITGIAGRVDAQESCTNASLQGSYAFQVDGTNVSNPHLPLGPFAAVGKNTYDGKGHMKGVITVSANGFTFPATYTGTYAVDSNCTGVKSATLSTGAVVNFFFVIDNDLREIKMIVTQAGLPGDVTDGLTVSGSARQVLSGKEAK